MTAHALSSTPNSTDGLCAVIEVVNELEEKEKQLPSWQPVQVTKTGWDS